MQRRTGAPVYISQMDARQAQLFWGSESTMSTEMAEYYRKHGLAESMVEQIPPHLKSFIPWVTPHPDVEWIQPGDSIRLGDRNYQILHTPGHADGHLSFFDAERGWLLAGDALLPRITPNISLWPQCHPNPLQLFLETLQRLKKLTVNKVFPAHGAVFTHFAERIEQLEKHHQTRLQKIVSQVQEEKQSHAAKICEVLFGRNLSIHNLRFALSETLAHLEYLVDKGLLVRKEEHGLYHYEQPVDLD